MPHQHAHTESATYGKAFAIGIGLNVLLVVLQLVYGIRAHALALVADAVHNLADVLALVLAWGATLLARRRPSAHWTYGLRSASIFAALINGIMLMLSNGAIAWEAIRRFSEPAPVQGITVIVVAAIGIAINGATAMMFMRGRAHDLNIRAAFLHMAGDAGVSLGVVIAGFIILKTGKVWVDPTVSLLIVAVITWSTWGLLRDSMRLALHAAPAEIDVDEVRAFLAALPGVERVLDLHIWAMSTTETALTAHLQMPGTADHDQFLQQTARILHDKFDIDHTTLQIEQAPKRENCALECG
jgi:cobalt-zinc-cadmium efflux system protein